MLGVNSRPSGKYSIDGEKKVRMGFKRVEVSPGPHTIYIEVETEDGSIRTKELFESLKAGETKSVCWDFNINAVCPTR